MSLCSLVSKGKFRESVVWV
nr:unnamed protein product [Callosobruchus chinensis]